MDDVDVDGPSETGPSVNGESENALPLPRRESRQHRIIEARERLYGRDVDPGARSGRVEDGALRIPDPRERSAETIPDRSRGAESSPRDGRRSPSRVRVTVVAALLVAFVTGAGLGLLLAPMHAVVESAPPLPSRPTLAGDVVRVADVSAVTVLVGDRSVDVAVLGLAPQPTDPTRPVPCGADTATAFARATLDGQHVTLVPDPVGPEFDGAGRRFAYVVLPTQQNYTDLALLQGIDRWDTTRTFTYGQVFAREEQTARSASAGMWGAPCRATP